MSIPNITTASYPDLYEHLETIAGAVKVAASSARSNPMLTPAGQIDALRAQDTRAGWTADVDAIEAELGRRIDAAAQAKAAAAPAPLAAGDVAGELRALRFWTRTRPVLDRADSPRSAVIQMIESCGDADLGTAIEEAPAYLESNGIRDGAKLIDEAVFHRSPAMQAAHADGLHAQTMRNSAFRGLLGHVREMLATAAPITPNAVVFKLAQVQSMDAERTYYRAA
ncbi:hypothetical protein ACFTSD_17570 [Nocardiaceae bacterium NPDC056970]